jgi:hypothetical protein
LQPGGHRFDPGQLHQKSCRRVKLMMQWISAIGGVWLVPIAAILVWGVIEIVKMALAHQERLALIERGIHPDSVKPDGVRKDKLA